MKIDREAIYKYLNQGKFDELGELCKEATKEEVDKELFLCAYDDNNIAVYFFVEYMYSKTHDEFWLELSFTIIDGALCCIEGAYSISTFKTRKLLEQERSIKNLENFLMQYRWPDCDIETKEAKQVAKDLLEIDPDNKLAKEILNS